MKLGSVGPPNLSFIFKMVLAIREHLHFHSKCWTTLSVSGIVTAGFLIEITLNLQINVDSIVMLMVINDVNDVKSSNSCKQGIFPSI